VATKRRTGKKFRAEKEVRAIARERIGTVKSARVITPKAERKPRYRKDFLQDQG
jgi:hypothetical protein